MATIRPVQNERVEPSGRGAGMEFSKEQCDLLGGVVAVSADRVVRRNAKRDQNIT